jgi:hypothetical protein
MTLTQIVWAVFFGGALGGAAVTLALLAARDAHRRYYSARDTIRRLEAMRRGKM